MKEDLQFGNKSLADVVSRINGLLIEYQEKISDALLRADDGVCAISLGVKLEAKHRGTNSIKVDIGFVESKVKDSSTGIVDELQADLFDMEGDDSGVTYPMRPGRVYTGADGSGVPQIEDAPLQLPAGDSAVVTSQS